MTGVQTCALPILYYLLGPEPVKNQGLSSFPAEKAQTVDIRIKSKTLEAFLLPIVGVSFASLNECFFFGNYFFAGVVDESRVGAASEG